MEGGALSIQMVGMKAAYGQLATLAGNPDWEPTPEEGWEAALQRDIPDPARFRAGLLREHSDVWEEYFRLSGNTTKSAKQAFRWIRDGIFCPMTEVEAPGQQAAPFHRRKVEVVKAMLAQTLPRGTDLGPFLEGNKPKKVAFQNHRSAITYQDFVAEELQGMLLKGVVKLWQDKEDPVVVNGLRVVDDKLPKLRLCINPMYINLFFKYHPLQYERLADVVDIAQPGDYAFTTDDKSGYWQCAVHPAMWKYLAFRTRAPDGEIRTYCFTHLPFGVGPACRIYTLIKQEIYRPLRSLGLKMVALIDDQMSMQRGVARTLFQSVAMCRLLGSLGWYLSWTKCQLHPTQTPKFLGMLVDLQHRAFIIPEDKQRGLVELVEKLREVTTMCDRTIAKVAGRVMALAPALQLAPLLARDMMKAMQGKGRWDEVYPSPEAMMADLDLLVLMMRRAEGRGKSWERRTQVIRVVGDASESALAAFTPDGQLEAPIIVPFTAAERAAVEENRLSSTVRELSVLGEVIITIEEQQPGLLSGKLLSYGTDSQPGMQGLMRMKGNPNTFPVVKKVRMMCWERDIDLEVVWRPREHHEQQEADDLTKLEDNNDWSLHPEVMAGLLAHPSLSGKAPALDCFASATNSVAPSYFSLYLGPGCIGIDAFKHSWSLPPDQWAFINGPFDQMGSILRKVIDDKVDAVIIAPLWPRPWSALWSDLPVRHTASLPHRPDLLLPGSLVPANKRRPKAPAYLIKAYYVRW